MATIQGSYILKHSAAQVPFVISFPLCDPEVKSRDKHRCSATKTFPPLIDQHLEMLHNAHGGRGQANLSQAPVVCPQKYLLSNISGM